MKKSVRLRPVRDLKQQQERTEAKKLADLQQQLQLARRKCEELEGYLKDYFTSINTQRQQVQQASQLALYQAFVSRLQQAIQHQQQIIKQRELAVQAQSRKWVTARERLRTMDDLIVRTQQQEQLEADKRDQKILDDRPFRPGGGFE